MSIAKNSLANLSGALAPLFIMLLTVPLYLQLIGTERYGVLAVIWVIFGYFGFFDLGLGQAINQKIAKLRGDFEIERNSLFWTSFLLALLLGIIGGIILFVFADQLLATIGDLTEAMQEEAGAAIVWLIPALPILITTSIIKGTLQGIERFVALNVIGVGGNLLIQLLPLCAAWMGYVGLEYLVPAALTGRLLAGIFLFYQCKKHLPLSRNFTFERSEVIPLLNYGGWFSIISMIAPFLVVVDRLVIAAVLGGKAVAFYTVPYNISSNAMKISGSLAGALFPRFSANPDDARDLADRATHVLVDVMTPAIVVGVLLFDGFLNVWLGQSFATEAKGVGELILIGVWINCLVIPHNSRLYAEANLKKIVAVYVVEIPLYFLMLWVGISYAGIQGAAMAWTLRVILDTFALLWLGQAIASSVSGKLKSLSIVLVAFALASLQSSQTLEYWLASIAIILIALFIGRTNLLMVTRTILTRL